MSFPALFTDLFDAVLPPVRNRPLPAMPQRLYRYILQVSGGQQLRLCLLTILVFPLTLAPLELQRRIVDGAIEGANLQMLLFLGGLYMAVIVVHGTVKFVRNFYLDRIAEGVTRVLRKRIAGTRPGDANADEGTRQALLSSEAENVGGFVAESLAFPLLQAGIVVSVAGYMLVVQPLIAVVALAFLLPAVLVVALTQPALNRLSGDRITAARELGESVLRNDADTDRDDADRDDRDKPEALVERIYALRLRFVAIKHAAKGFNNVINLAGPLSILLLGGWLVIEGRAELGTIVAFMSGYERMSDPSRQLLNFYRRLSMMRVQYRLVHEAGSKD